MERVTERAGLSVSHAATVMAQGLSNTVNAVAQSTTATATTAMSVTALAGWTFRVATLEMGPKPALNALAKGGSERLN